MVAATSAAMSASMPTSAPLLSKNHYVEQVEAFGRALHDDTLYPVPLEFSQGTQSMIDKVFAAANQQ